MWFCSLIEASSQITLPNPCKQQIRLLTKKKKKSLNTCSESLLPWACLSRTTQEAPGNGFLELQPPLDSERKEFSRKDKIMGQHDKVTASPTASTRAQCDSRAQAPTMPAAGTTWEGTRNQFGFTPLFAVVK